MAVCIITDSTSDFTCRQAQELRVEILSQKVRFGQREYIDGPELTPEEFYQKLAQSDQLPQTAQVNPQEFYQAFRQALDRGDQVFGLFLSSDLSGTYQSALAARDLCGGRDIYLTDSRSVALGLNLLVRQAVALRQRGAGAEQIQGEIERTKGRVRLCAAVDTLKYLRMGGRLSGAAAALGGLLNIKPLVAVEQGRVEAVAKARGQQAALQWLEDQLERQKPDLQYPVIFGHSAASALCQDFAHRVLPRLPGCDWHIAQIGSAVGTHVGPGAVGLAYVEKE